MKTRIISALVLLVIFIPLLLIGKLPFAIFMTLVALLGLKELLDIRKKNHELPFLVEISSYIIVSFMTLSHYQSKDLYFLMDYRLMSAIMFVFLAPIVFINDNNKYNFSDALYFIASTIFLGLSFNLFILVRNFSLEYVIFLFLISIFTDTFAYITGKYIGKNKLAPRISPNKTIEGLLGGTIMGVFISTVYYTTVIDTGADLGFIICITTLLSLIGQLGDLIFSAIKRYYGVKDFSNLIPGHGGVLDRLDSIIFIFLGFILFIAVL